jgi:hypothetical protein
MVDIEPELYCYKEVWSESKTKNKMFKGILNDDEKKKLRAELWQIIVEENRKVSNARGNSCFYFKLQEGMSLESAAELEDRESESKEASADRKWLKRGVWATFTAVIVSAVISRVLFVVGYYWQ